MKKTLIIIVGIIILLIAGFFALNSYIYNEKQGDQTPILTHKDATYVLGGEVVKLEGNVKYFGNEVSYDFDKDGREDKAFIITHQPGGSGTFYYVVAALNKETGYEGSQGLLLGDRISPQTTEIKDGLVVVNYADRKPNEPFTTQPSVGKSLRLKLDVNSMQFGEVAQDFEGEANPNTMTLTMKKWTWINAQYNDGRTVTPKKTLAFTLEFLPTGQFSATTDCNEIGGKYVAKNGVITFSEMISTKMFCEGSQETDFATLLTNSSGYHFTSKGELILDLKFDSGTVVFR